MDLLKEVTKMDDHIFSIYQKTGKLTIGTSRGFNLSTHQIEVARIILDHLIDYDMAIIDTFRLPRQTGLSSTIEYLAEVIDNSILVSRVRPNRRLFEEGKVRARADAVFGLRDKVIFIDNSSLTYLSSYITSLSSNNKVVILSSEIHLNEEQYDLIRDCDYTKELNEKIAEVLQGS